MPTTTTMVDYVNHPSIVLRGFEPCQNFTSVTNPNSVRTLSGRPSFVCKTDDSKNWDIIAEQETCLQSPMVCEPNTKRILLNDVSPRPCQRDTLEKRVTIETDNKDEIDEIDESAIEEDSDDENWEDVGEEESGHPNVDTYPLFQRVDSKPKFTSHRSLLTFALDQYDRASALQNAASRSSPAICRSCIWPPITPSTDSSPQENSGLTMKLTRAFRSNLSTMITPNVHPPAMSPKTTRCNMFASELPKSLQQNLLLERQQRNVPTNAVAKRQQSAANPPILHRAMTTGDLGGLQNEKNLTGDRDIFAPASCDYNKSGW